MPRCLLCSALIAWWPVFLFAQSGPIAAARTQPPGTLVGVRGVVTSGAELGKIRFLQDGTGGIAAYPGAGSAAGFEQNVDLGDSVQITGTLVSYHGLLEINPITDYQVISSGNVLPAPKVIGLDQVSEAFESQLVRINCASFGDAGGVFSSYGTYGVTDPGGAAGQIYLSGDSPLPGGNIPTIPVQLTAILSQYDDFQLLPRDFSDLAPSACLYFTEKLRQFNIQTDGFAVRWKTNVPSGATLRYGVTPTSPDEELVLPGPAPEYILGIGDLQPGVIYWVQVLAYNPGDTLYSEIVPFATRALSSGQIKVFFNHSVEESFLGSLAPNGQSFEACRDEIIARIDAAQQTLDVAVYNNNRTDITNALKLAQARGVRVRYIASDDTQNTALDPAPPFPVVYGNANALMHDKFMVIDADLSDQAWVMSGSMNWTTGNMTNDYNNLLFIQDQSLARAYELEFEEMWGSAGDLPEPANGRFGAAKKDNTPHQFIIGDIPVESYFSPSDGVTARIVETIQKSEETAEFAMFSFTKNEPGDALVEAFANGVAVRGMIENLNDPGCEFDHLAFNGVPVQAHTTSGDLHHKYVVTDAFLPASDPTVLTGSHNWSQNAESANDENTLVIHDAGIARLFAAEFERRWVENTTAAPAPANGASLEIFPNPVDNILTVKNLSGNFQNCHVTVTDVTGRRVAAIAVFEGDVMRLDVHALPRGVYVLRLQTADAVAVRGFEKI